MKIEIDLNEILGDEDGVETLADSVRRQVINKLTYEIKTNIQKHIDIEISKFIQETIKEHIVKFMPETIEHLMTTEYVQVDRYGDRKKEPTTFRKELIKAITEQMVYTKPQYSSDKNMFTKTIDDLVESKVNAFKTDFNKQVDASFTKECMDYAVTKLQQKLGIK